MAEVSLVCVRDDAWKADLLSAALERYGFTVCRSASVFEDFGNYAAIVVLLSPGAARSELVMATAGRALDWGKLIPVFVNICHLPDKLAGVALHDLSAWDGLGEDPVVQAIAYHAQRLAGLPGRPSLGPQASPRQLAAPVQAWIEPPGSYDHYDPTPPRYDLEANYARGFGRTSRHYSPSYIAAAHNELNPAPMNASPMGANMRALDVHVAVSSNDSAAQRRARYLERNDYFDPTRHSFSAATAPFHYEEETETPPRQLPPFFTVVFCAVALMGMAWMEEARTRELPRAIPAEATADLSAPSTVDPGDAPRQRLADRR